MSSLVFCVFELLLVLFCWHSHFLGEIWFCLGFVDVLRCLASVFVVVSYECVYGCVCVCVCIQSGFRSLRNHLIKSFLLKQKINQIP